MFMRDDQADLKINLIYFFKWNMMLKNKMQNE